MSAQFSEVTVQMAATHSSVEDLQRSADKLVRQNELQLQSIQSVEQRIMSLQGNVSVLAENVRKGQQKLSELLATSNQKQNQMLQHLKALSRDLRGYHIQEMLSQFEANWIQHT